MAMRFLTACALLVVVAAACSHNKGKTESAAAAPARAAPEAVRAIEVPKYQATLPDAPFQEVFASACLTCHSPRYITMQPPMSAAQWEERLRKLSWTGRSGRRAYGADDAAAADGPDERHVFVRSDRERDRQRRAGDRDAGDAESF